MRTSCGPAALVAVVALLVAPSTYGADPLEHVHSSSRYDRSPASLVDQAHRIRARGPDVTTWTEVQGTRAVALARVPGPTYLAPGTDVAVSWRGDRWRLVGARSARLAGNQGAAWVVLDRRKLSGRPAGRASRILVTLAHLPSHVEYGDHWRTGEPRAALWRAAVAAWAHQLRTVIARRGPARVLVVADWNIDMRRPAWRAVIRAQFPDLELTWRVGALPRSGTHAGRRLIDATLTNGPGAARLLPDDASSDHRPYAEVLR